MESFGLEDLEADFDPDSYDSVMGRVFDAGYYEGGEGEEDKPEFSDFELEEEMEGEDSVGMVTIIYVHVGYS